jgi:hypothetical protein
VTEGLQFDWVKAPRKKTTNESQPTSLEVVRELLKADKRLQKVVEIRKKIDSGLSKSTAVVSPLALLELIIWNAESTFKQYASEAASVYFIQKKSKKEIGDYLKRIIQLRRDEIVEQTGTRQRRITGLSNLWSDLWVDRSFADSHGLGGLLQADVVNFELTLNQAWQEPSAYAYLQLGISDILHILIAQHLRCTYIASFDEDFRRAKDIIEAETEMKVLTSPEDILQHL